MGLRDGAPRWFAWDESVAHNRTPSGKMSGRPSDEKAHDENRRPPLRTRTERGEEAACQKTPRPRFLNAG